MQRLARAFIQSVLAMVALAAPPQAVPLPSAAQPPAPVDVQADTWHAVDGLGRALPTAAEVGPPRAGKTVGVFYFLWHNHHTKTGPHDITRILRADPDAMSKPESPLWGPLNAFHQWGEPLFGFYTSLDTWVYRKHAQMLADAGVDYVAFDMSNNFIYPDELLALLGTWDAMRREGNATPRVTFLCPFNNPAPVVAQVHELLFKTPRFADLMMTWPGADGVQRPLMLANPEQVAPEFHSAFTFRATHPVILAKPGLPNGWWGWMDTYPQQVYNGPDGKPEMMTVSIGQNATNNRLTAFSEPGTQGRSWHAGAKDTRSGAVELGLNIAEQWERALAIDPPVIFITGWNEWSAMRLQEFGDWKAPVLFVDAYTQEYSRDIEPMRELGAPGSGQGHGDHYYYQMIAAIRRFKGARAIEAAGGPRAIVIDGKFDDWAAATPVYRDTIGDTAHRNAAGIGTAGPYVNETGRNDIVEARVAYDADHVCFYARTHDALTSASDAAWMNLWVDTDRTTEPMRVTTAEPGSTPEWAGFELHVAPSLTMIGEPLQWRRGDHELELAIPRAQLGLAEPTPPRFDFKWSDNATSLTSPMDFTTQGDAAPNDRYVYPFVP